MRKMLNIPRVKFTLRTIGFIVIILGLLLLVPSARAAFPEKPIKIVVYTGPGGLIDITARKFSTVAVKYTDVNFVVENKPGAGGIVALKSVLQAPANGYNLFACTKSNIAKFVLAGGSDYVDALDWTAMLMADPECVITNRKQDINDWMQIVEHAHANPGQQNWVGPAAGGLDHVTALKIWDEAQIEAKWIPYKSGGKAIAALLGEQGVAYVGNPRDILGNPDLKIAAISSETRLERFPDAPTFSELGFEGLENEYMWRGFALKKGTPPEVLAWYADLFAKVTEDPDWKEFWGRGGIDVTYLGGDAFTELVQEDAKVFEYYLKKSSILQTSDAGLLSRLSSGTPFLILASILFALYAAISYLVYRSSFSVILGRVMVIGAFLLISILFLVQTMSFPKTSAVGPSVVPQLWIAFLVPLNFILLVRTFKHHEEVAGAGPRIDLVLGFVGLLFVYLLIMQIIGYFISTFIFILTALFYLGYRNKRNALIITSSWILFSYIIFYKTLYLPLPLGMLFKGWF